MKQLNSDLIIDGRYQVVKQSGRLVSVVRDEQQIFTLSKSRFSLQTSTENDLLALKKYTDNKYLSSLLSVLLKKKTTKVSISLPFKPEILKYLASVISVLNPFREIKVSDLIEHNILLKTSPPKVEIFQALTSLRSANKYIPILGAFRTNISVSSRINNNGWYIRTQTAGYYMTENGKLYILWKDKDYEMSEFEKIKKYLGENQSLFEWLVKNIKVYRIVKEEDLPILIDFLKILKTYKNPPTELHRMHAYFLVDNVVIYDQKPSNIDISGLFGLVKQSLIKVYFIGKNELMIEITDLRSYKEAVEMIKEIRTRLDQIKIRGKPILLPKKHFNFSKYYENTTDYIPFVVRKTHLGNCTYTAIIIKPYRLPTLLSRLSNISDRGSLGISS